MSNALHNTLATPAWLLVGITGSVGGLLEMAGGRLAFTTDEEQVFNEPLQSVSEVKFPWYYFGGGVKLTVSGRKYRISFVQPNGAEDIPARLLARTGSALGIGLGLLTVGRKIRDIGTGRRAGKAWQTILTAAVMKSEN